jgi:hypothetical protein
VKRELTGGLKAMWTAKLKTSAAILLATAAVSGGLLAQQPKIPAAVAEAGSKPADSAAMAQTEAKLAKLRELIRPQPGEYVTSMAKIAWERDPWQAAVKAGKEGKPVLAYGVASVGVTCGYG